MHFDHVHAQILLRSMLPFPTHLTLCPFVFECVVPQWSMVDSRGLHSQRKLTLPFLATNNNQKLHCYGQDFMTKSHLHAGIWSGLSLFMFVCAVTTTVSTYVRCHCSVLKSLFPSPLALTHFPPSISWGSLEKQKVQYSSSFSVHSAGYLIWSLVYARILKKQL